VEILAQSSTAFVLTHTFQGTHILGASRGRLSDSVASCSVFRMPAGTMRSCDFTRLYEFVRPDKFRTIDFYECGVRHDVLTRIYTANILNELTKVRRRPRLCCLSSVIKISGWENCSEYLIGHIYIYIRIDLDHDLDLAASKHIECMHGSH